MDWTGQRKQKKKMGFRLQKEAKQFEIDFLSKTAKNCDMSFGSMVDIYMEDCKARLKPTTYQGKEAVIAKHILPYFRHLRINDIQPMTVRRWQTDLINSTQNYKPTYLRTLNSQLSAIFNFAMKYYGLPSNPVQKSGTIGKKHSGLEQYWTVDEFKVFIEAISDKPMSVVIFNLLYWSGMRSGELLALTLNDFDFEVCTVSITKNYARMNGEDLFLEPKTPKSNRKITLPQFVCDLVKNYGCDALRLYELFVGPPELDAEWDDRGIDGVYRFLNRFWNLVQASKDLDIQPTKEMIKLRNRLVYDIETRFEQFSLNTVISGFMEYNNKLIELSKKQGGIDKETLKTFVILLAPFAPHMGEELWEQLGGTDSVFHSQWPKYEEEHLKDDEVEIAVQINGKTKGTVTIPADITKEDAIETAKKALGDKLNGVIVKEIYVPGRIINIVQKPAK